VREDKFFWLLGSLIWFAGLSWVAWLFFAWTFESLRDPVYRSDAWLIAVPGLVFAGGAAFCAHGVRRRLRQGPDSGYGGEAASMVLVIGCAIVYPRFGELLRYSGEGANKGNLGAVRAALDGYAKTKGRPAALDALVKEGALPYLPRLSWRGPHRSTRESLTLEPGVFTDSGRWGYSVEASTPVYIDCTHTDSRGLAWNNY
jgi:type II secretory pathway pseudopilin PulG